MNNEHGDFIWYELLTSDADAAGDFYGKVVGWTSQPSGQPDVDYRFFCPQPDDGVGGYMQITPEMAQHGARPAWIGYLAVEDVDASVAAIKAAGGAELMPAMDLDGVGRMAMVADPTGAPFYVMRGASDEPSQSFAATAPRVGHAAWNELSSSDPANAKTFYTSLFGWVQDGEMDMGPMGRYEFLWASGKRFMQGAVMPLMPEVPVSAWTFYFRVPDIDVAAARVRAEGGSLLMEPVEIPGGDFSFTATDPQGAVFGLVGARA